MSFEGDPGVSRFRVVPSVTEEISPQVMDKAISPPDPVPDTYQSLLDAQGWRITREYTTDTSAQPLIARTVARVIDSGVPLPEIKVGECAISPFDEDRNIRLKPVAEEIIKALVTDKKRELTILIPGITLLAIGNRIHKGPYDLKKFCQHLFINVLREELAGEYGLRLDIRFNTGRVVGTEDGIAIFPDYYSVTLVNAGPPTLEVV